MANGKRIDELPVINDLGAITSIPVIIDGTTYQLDLTTRVVSPLQNQINTAIQNQVPVTLTTITGTLDPTKVGTFTGGANLSTKVAELDVLTQTAVPSANANIQQLFTRVTSLENRVSVLEAVPPSPSPPVIVTSPTVSWPGGSANVAETGTITNGTYSGTALNGSRTFQLVNNSTAIGPRFSGSTTPALVASGTAQVIEYAPYGSAGAEVANPSIVYAVAAAPAPPPQVPVVATSPILAFTGGGAPDVGDTATITEGTYTGGTVTGRTGQVLVNDIFHSNVANGATGNTFVVPAEAGSGARKLTYVEQAANTAGGPVPNASPAYTVNLPGVPVNTVAPQILPTSATSVDTLSPTLGTYTVSGTVVDNSTLTFTYRWTFDWTMTGSLSGATSANFTANWLGTTGSYTVWFSDGSSRTTTLTNGSTAFSWTGAVTANATAKVQVATTATLLLNANNVGHAARFYVTPTGAGGAGAEVEASNTVTATAVGGPDPGVIWTGLTAGQWSEIVSRGGVIGDTLSGGAEAAVNAIPTTGGVTINPGADVRATVAANSRVFLTAGTYTMTAGSWANWRNKEVIGVAGQVVNIDLVNMTGPSVEFESIVTNGSKIVNLRFLNAASVCLHDEGNSLFYKVLCDKQGHVLGTKAWGHGLMISPGGGTRVISCEFRKAFSHAAGSFTTGYFGQSTAGGDGNGLYANGAANFYADVHFPDNSDDGIDFWQATGSQKLYFCSSIRSGICPEFPAANQQGDGNGFKLGPGNVVHHLYKCVANNNKLVGFDRNSNTQVPLLEQCSGTGNGGGLQNF